jgi:hypothetical protein
MFTENKQVKNLKCQITCHSKWFEKTRGRGCVVGGGGVGVGGKRFVKVWDNFGCAARARLCL